jgi:glycosyltransferase involved in cell wall biosynthesis
MKVIIFTKYSSNAASSRLRTYQYLEYFLNHGMDIKVSPLFDRQYLIKLYANKSIIFEALKGYFIRFITVFSAYKYDLVVVEKELFPYLPAVIEKLFTFVGIKYIADYDDAIFHNYDLSRNKYIRYLLSKKISVVMHNASAVTVGSEYLHDYALQSKARQILLLPTSIDITRYVPVLTTNNKIVVGWIGTPKTSKYLSKIIPLIRDLSDAGLQIELMIVGAKNDRQEDGCIQYYSWAEKDEVSLINMMDIGIMPLPDEPWERGKCGYKLIQYMACAKPVIASPVGINVELVSQDVGILAGTEKEWEHAINKLYSNQKLRIRLGQNGRKLVTDKYTIQKNHEKYYNILKSVADCE